MNDRNFYITTPIYYANDVPHIGHAYTTVVSDTIARFKRLDGYNVMFLTGTDEHGQKIFRAAERHSVDTQEFVDQLVPRFKYLWEKMNCKHDYFIRTTNDEHKKFVQNIWNRMLETGYIYLGKYSGWYATRDEAFYNELELVDGKAPTGAEVEWVEEPSYFFKLSAFGEKLLSFFEQNPNFVLPGSRYNEVKAFVRSGLRDISISRIAVKWGIPVPGDDQHVMYVWLDALFNYISALHIVDKVQFWPCDLHLIGKDILQFHAVYWPAFLMAVDLPLPKQIFAHGWWKNKGEKMSKSLGNVIDPNDIIDEFNGDCMRYFMLREMPLGRDGNYCRDAFVQRINVELVNNIGNLVQRVLAFTHRYYGGKVPQHSNLCDNDIEMLASVYGVMTDVREFMNAYAIHEAINCILEVGHKANAYMEKSAPWRLKDHDIDRMNNVIFVLLECVRVIGVLMQPFAPDSVGRIISIFYGNANRVQFAVINDQIKANSTLNKIEYAFTRLE